MKNNIKLINLDKAVINALDLFSLEKPPKMDLDKINLPFVIGSGNAYNTGKLIFSQKAAIFADESNFKTLLKSYELVIKKGLISQAIIISASGEKDSVWEIELANKSGLKTHLLTCSPNSSAAKAADKVYLFKKLPEPYTYNVSTYLGMVLASTNENPKIIREFIGNVKLKDNFSTYQSYSFILDDKYIDICPMIDIKKSELFGSRLSIRCFTNGHARHAKFVIPWEKELVVSIGTENKYFGHPNHRLSIELPETASFGTILSLTYFIVGKVQESKPHYYKENIKAYCRDYGPKAYGKNTPFEIIVPGN
ncbi:hypothetical protein COT75_00280 [Candidatus Beckwithbacteria bacterium CG10_big_fil_rev_8_21_14_0_10_34_10]|uniref:SIS domain-containing protein n=1 Tax=Candidatus Beckwithbacteria bacterium CG10_big_fil_rev_8_21_14_0_10_34_10 TaxID=1974495 RepID=A0A2H0WAD2_9BACT|nr:MAG: hypothetical protein COT75_00280 [Candidatus Beckwithbacteria bacterium CG10_big_fil_rev_8_21_14_0_10_34_10]